MYRYTPSDKYDLFEAHCYGIFNDNQIFKGALHPDGGITAKTKYFKLIFDGKKSNINVLSLEYKCQSNEKYLKFNKSGEIGRWKRDKRRFYFMISLYHKHSKVTIISSGTI